jgi:hypothetical protein
MKLSNNTYTILTSDTTGVEIGVCILKKGTKIYNLRRMTTSIGFLWRFKSDLNSEYTHDVFEYPKEETII